MPQQRTATACGGRRRLACATWLVAGLAGLGHAWAGGSGADATAPAATPAADPAPVATPAVTPAPAIDADFLADPDNIAAGKAIWHKQCRHCHGRSAYPGKAPKLKPRKYSADFVYDRVTNGFRKMPAWKEVFSDEQRRAVVAYVLSRDFSP
jgi:mono/diheme cytochrome c family protein